MKQRQGSCKGALSSTLNMGIGSHKLFIAAVDELLESLPIFCELGSEVSYFIPEFRIFQEVTKFSADTRKSWLKATLK